MKIIDINGEERNCVKTYPDPDYAGYMKVEYKNAVRSHHEWYPIEDFLKNNPDLSKLIKNAPPIIGEVVGVVTKSTKIGLTDRNQKWDENIYKGFPVWISRGNGEGQTRGIVSNTKNSIIVDRPWDAQPDKSSQFVISKNIHTPKAFGNTLPGFD